MVEGHIDEPPHDTSCIIDQSTDANCDDGSGDEAVPIDLTGEKVPIAYDATDTTEDVPHPAKYVFMLPTAALPNLSSLRFVKYPHPRHGALTTYVTYTQDQRTILCEVQHHRPQHCTWFIEDDVEPTPRMFVVTPMDWGFVALHFCRTCDNVNKFVSFPEMLLCCSEGYRGLGLGQAEPLRCALNLVCDTKAVDLESGVETFYRYSEERAVSWLVSKFTALMDCAALKSLCLTRGAPQTGGKGPSEEDKAHLAFNAVVLLAEYVEDSLTSRVCQDPRVGVPYEMLTARFNAAKSSSSHFSSSKKGDNANTDENADLLPAKKSRLETSKSASVKRLEKAGPPKGVPSLMSMFSRKPSSGSEGSLH